MMTEENSPHLKKYFTVKNFAQRNKKLGIWPDTEASIWALKAQAEEKGLSNGIFLKMGRRVLIDEEQFFKTLTEIHKQQGNKNG